VNQGDVYWAIFRPPDTQRPVVILTRDGMISHLSSISVAPTTTTIRNIGSHVKLTPEDGVPEVCEVNLDYIQTITKDRFKGFITHLNDEKMEEICRAIEFAYGFDRYISEEADED
jgi:mRNA interferase MazF